MHDLLPWRVKKLPDDTLAYLVPDADIKTDASKMRVDVIVSTESLDRERDILIAKGCRTGGHQKNPIVLLNHRKDWPGIARAEDPDGNYTVKVYDGEVRASHWFNQDTKLAVQAFRLIESGAMRGVSPGFLTVPDHVHKIKAADGHPATMYTAWDLVEVTHCPVGMNQDAIVVAVKKGFTGGEQLLPELKDMLTPFMPPERAQVVSGWEKEKSASADLVEPSEIDLSDAEAVPLTTSTQFYHAVWQKTFDSLGMTEELRSVQEVERTKADAKAILALQGKILDICRAGHNGHAADYPGQPGLPGELGDDIAATEMAEWRVKALETYDAWKSGLKQAAATESTADIKAAVDFLKTVANDRRQATNLRAGARQFASRLERVKMVSLPPGDDDDAIWGQVELKLNSVLQVTKS